ncbi:retrotransposon protein, putative, ty1-copia subclass [Tanacetum coccineum]
MVRSMMSQTTIPKSFWDYALESVAHILNMVPTKKVDRTPYEIWHGQALKLSTRTRHPTDRLCLYIDAEEYELGDHGEPANYKATLKDPESEKWLAAMNVEMQSMKDNDVWELVELPPNAKTVSYKWIFKKKTDMDGAVHTFKSRLVAKGFTQTYRVDYEKTFSPIADIRAIRILIAIAAFYVKTAFLNGHLSKEVYMTQPEGFVNLKYPNHKASGSYVTFLILYVDDILIMGNNILMLEDVKSYLGRCFAMKDLGEAAYILGTKIYRDRSKRLIGLCQSAYSEKILRRYSLENSKRGTIPMQEKLKLSTIIENDSKETFLKDALSFIKIRVDIYIYENCELLYALTPAEMRHMSNVPYASAVGSIMYATGYVFFLNGGDVDWKSTKQSFFVTSSTDAEYIASFDASKEAVWIRKFIFGLNVVPTIEESITMYCDNSGAIAITKDHGVTKGA